MAAEQIARNRAGISGVLSGQRRSRAWRPPERNGAGTAWLLGASDVAPRKPPVTPPTGRLGRLPRARREGAAVPLRDRIRLRTIVTPILLTLVGCGALWLGREAWFRVLRSELFLVRELTVTGAQTLSSGEILATAGLTYRLSLLKLDPEALRKRLIAHPRVAGAAVKLDYPGAVAVTVSERAPSFLLCPDPGTRPRGSKAANSPCQVVSGDGVLIGEARPSDRPESLARLYHALDAAPAGARLKRSILALWAHLGAPGGQGHGKVEQILLTSHGVEVCLPQGWRVKVGYESALEQWRRFEAVRATAFWAQSVASGGRAGGAVDARWQNQVVARPSGSGG
ncbi:MAG: FtsQ-type POTRA domain-containing protein [Candidatus Schekmanbacteria bacterium]|nr:FtsQ-type POTRA domain-containing protein [Candidatus Schekmanbacteria bacterium]